MNSSSPAHAVSFFSLRWMLGIILYSVLFLYIPLHVVSAAPSPESSYIKNRMADTELASLPVDSQSLTREEAVQVLFDLGIVTPDSLYTGSDPAYREMYGDIAPSDPLYVKVATLCDLDILRCSMGTLFKKMDPVTLPAFLKMWMLLEWDEHEKKTQFERFAHPEAQWFTPFMEYAKAVGYIRADRRPEDLFTREQLFYILYRHTLYEQYKEVLPGYFHGLVAQKEEVIVDRFYRPDEILQIMSSYQSLLERMSKRALEESDFNIKADMVVKIHHIQGIQKMFREVYEEVAKHPLWYDRSYTEAQREAFRTHGIHEVIGEGYYDFRSSASYRKRNIWATLAKMDGIILQPGEEFDFWKIMREKGMGDIGNGWIISGGQEVWGWGGGLCGAATALFRGAWFSGMEITERRPHSIYYTDMYTRADVGLDAMVALGSSNLRFRNTSGAPVMIHIAYKNASKGEVFIRLLGTRHVRSIDFPAMTRQGGWYIRSRNLHYLDGTVKEDSFRSSYRKFM